MKWLTMLLIVGMQRLNALMGGLSVLELLIGLPMTCVLTRYVSESSPNACTIENDYFFRSRLDDVSDNKLTLDAS
jgi:hypothetical protein